MVFLTLEDLPFPSASPPPKHAMHVSWKNDSSIRRMHMIPWLARRRIHPTVSSQQREKNPNYDFLAVPVVGLMDVTTINHSLVSEANIKRDPAQPAAQPSFLEVFLEKAYI